MFLKKLIFFNRVITKLQVAFYHLKISDKFLRYKWSKLGRIKGTFKEGKTVHLKFIYIFIFQALLLKFS